MQENAVMYVELIVVSFFERRNIKMKILVKAKKGIRITGICSANCIGRCSTKCGGKCSGLLGF